MLNYLIKNYDPIYTIESDIFCKSFLTTIGNVIFDSENLIVKICNLKNINTIRTTTYIQLCFKFGKQI